MKGDFSGVVDAIQKLKNDFSPYGHIVKEIKFALSEMTLSGSFNMSRENFNQVADQSRAKHALHCNNVCIGMNYVLDCVSSLVKSELSIP